MRKSAIAVIILTLTLTGCTSSREDESSRSDVPDSRMSTTTPGQRTPGDFSVTDPPRESGTPRPYDSADEGSSTRVSPTPKTRDKPAEQPRPRDSGHIEIAGPTLNDEYPEFFGNLFDFKLSNCAFFSNTEGSAVAYPIRVEGISVDPPFRLLSGCEPDVNKQGLEERPVEPGCRAGVLVPVASGEPRIGCTAGVEYPSDLSRSKENHTGALVLRLSILCTNSTSSPCSETSVRARRPTPGSPVRVLWNASYPVRYCGATDYANEDGGPGGDGDSSEYGCTD